MATIIPDIAARLREMSDEHESANPYQVSEDIIDKLSDADCREALRLCLPQYIKRLDHRYLTVQQVDDVPDVPARQPGRPHAEAIAQHQDRHTRRRLTWLAKREALGDGTYKRLGDLTSAELRTCARIRYQHADAVNAVADRYMRWADQVEEQGAATLAEAVVKLGDKWEQ